MRPGKGRVPDYAATMALSSPRLVSFQARPDALTGCKGNLMTRRQGDMRKPLMVLLTASFLLTACGGWRDAGVNPRNWFGNSRSVAAEVPVDGETLNPLIPRRSAIASRPDPVDTSVPVAAITELRVDRTTTGAIVLVTAIAARQGAYDTELRPDPVSESNPADVLSFTLRVVYPDDPTAVGTERTRTINEAYSLTAQELRGIRLIRVSGAQNSMETRRR